MSTSQDKSNMTVMPIPNVDMASDGEDKQVVNLEAVAREAAGKLEKDLVEVKVQNDEIVWKKQEHVDQKVAEKKHKEDEDVAVVKKKADEDAKKKGLVQPLVVSLPVFFWKAGELTCFLV